MSLLSEIAITPDVLREDGYAQPGLCQTTLSLLRRVFLDEVLVRDLRGGDWSRLILEGNGLAHPLGKELVKKLRQGCRLIGAEAESAEPPSDDTAWADEAIKSHNRRRLAAILAGKRAACAREATPVCAVDKVQTSAWWQARSCSMRLPRKLNDYLAALDLLLKHANSLTFIDPYLDPTRHNYREFGSLVTAARRASCQPVIELHRACRDGSGPIAAPLPWTAWKDRFARLGEELRQAGLRAKVFIWDDFHDRYLVTNLLGICLPNGFDTSEANQRTTWTRLSSKDRDDVQREFEQASSAHELRGSFFIGIGA